MNRRQVILAISVGFLLISSFLFYNSYQLWFKYQEALGYYRQEAEKKSPYTIIRPYPYAYYVENYERFFLPSITAGVAFLIVVIALFIYRKKVELVKNWNAIPLFLGIVHVVAALFLLSSIFYFREIFVLRTLGSIPNIYDFVAYSMFPSYILAGTIILILGLLEIIFIFSWGKQKSPK